METLPNLGEPKECFPTNPKLSVNPQNNGLADEQILIDKRFEDANIRIIPPAQYPGHLSDWYIQPQNVSMWPNTCKGTGHKKENLTLHQSNAEQTVSDEDIATELMQKHGWTPEELKLLKSLLQRIVKKELSSNIAGINSQEVTEYSKKDTQELETKESEINLAGTYVRRKQFLKEIYNLLYYQNPKADIQNDSYKPQDIPDFKKKSLQTYQLPTNYSSKSIISRWEPNSETSCIEESKEKLIGDQYFTQQLRRCIRNVPKKAFSGNVEENHVMDSVIEPNYEHGSLSPTTVFNEKSYNSGERMFVENDKTNSSHKNSDSNESFDPKSSCSESQMTTETLLEDHSSTKSYDILPSGHNSSGVDDGLDFISYVKDDQQNNTISDYNDTSANKERLVVSQKKEHFNVGEETILNNVSHQAREASMLPDHTMNNMRDDSKIYVKPDDFISNKMSLSDDASKEEHSTNNVSSYEPSIQHHASNKISNSSKNNVLTFKPIARMEYNFSQDSDENVIPTAKTLVPTKPNYELENEKDTVRYQYDSALLNGHEINLPPDPSKYKIKDRILLNALENKSKQEHFDLASDQQFFQESTYVENHIGYQSTPRDHIIEEPVFQESSLKDFPDEEQENYKHVTAVEDHNVPLVPNVLTSKQTIQCDHKTNNSSVHSIFNDFIFKEFLKQISGKDSQNNKSDSNVDHTPDISRYPEVSALRGPHTSMTREPNIHESLWQRQRDKEDRLKSIKKYRHRRPNIRHFHVRTKKKGSVKSNNNNKFTISKEENTIGGNSLLTIHKDEAEDESNRSRTNYVDCSESDSPRTKVENFSNECNDDLIANNISSPLFNYSKCKERNEVCCVM